ncbi:phosphohistidine phosphatase SixA [Vibrio sagamiensis]|uniref:Phosphohistidine phosphatase SixA n=1 Tax=Vibrio sagamiensis NBRC 104589 TaxID=1219064 RepID=A0A511QAN2_9VIBR|nr:phosphohistidine phosphatase SixA [Vibrio sagamiensis]PNQ71427.1 phosphohistidine phosphatase SixA [Vibrio agarivorans]GEM74371.1 phosphohistidine phosphatase SixA [Vibrio sagamiensis NBRC 104589]
MKIFILRHGEAEQFANSDAERQLTPRGRAESEVVAQVCKERGFAQFDKVLVSPYIRAQQTWQEISTHFSAKCLETCEDITPYGQSDQVFDFINALIEVENTQSLLLVSHLPLVGYLISEFVKGMTPPMFPTSGLVCIEFDPQTQSGEILWHITP